MTELANKIGIRTIARSGGVSLGAPGSDEDMTSSGGPCANFSVVPCRAPVGISASGRFSLQTSSAPLLHGGEPVVKHDAAPPTASSAGAC